MPRSTLEPCDTAARAVDEADFGLLISAISTKLINSSLAQSHHHIEEALALLGRGGSKDRCYVFRFSDDYSTMSNTYEWTNDGIQGYQHELQNIPTQSMAYFYETIREHGLIVVNHIDELPPEVGAFRDELVREDRKSTRLNSSHVRISYAVFCLKKKKKKNTREESKEQK